VGESCNEEAQVTAIQPDGRARVTVERGEACHACAARGACQTLGGQTRSFEILVENGIGAAPGDRVVLALDESALIKASAVLYLLPAVGLLGGALGGYGIAAARGLATDPAAIAGSVAGLLAGLLASRLVSRVLERKRTFVPRMIRVVGPAAPGTPPE
jgi:sigma-E factor negative regulatory protein RseC